VDEKIYVPGGSILKPSGSVLNARFKIIPPLRALRGDNDSLSWGVASGFYISPLRGFHRLLKLNPTQTSQTAYKS
jgi:hypothetical protein